LELSAPTKPPQISAVFYLINRTEADIQVKVLADDQQLFIVKVQPQVRQPGGRGTVLPLVGFSTEGIQTQISAKVKTIEVQEMVAGRTMRFNVAALSDSEATRYMITVADQSITLSRSSLLTAVTTLFVKVLLGPTCPVLPPGSTLKCAPKPLQAQIAVQTPDGAQTLATLMSDPRGDFGAALPPGQYRLHPLSLRPAIPPFPPRDMLVELLAGQVTFVQILYDSGIR